jgi:hypothetical protein
MRVMQTVVALAAMAPAVAYADISEGPRGGGGVGIAIGIVVGVAVILGGVWLAWRKRAV